MVFDPAEYPVGFKGNLSRSSHSWEESATYCTKGREIRVIRGQVFDDQHKTRQEPTGFHPGLTGYFDAAAWDLGISRSLSPEFSEAAADAEKPWDTD